MTSIRPAAVAGLFYPRNPDTLLREVQGYIKQAAPPDRLDIIPRALIAPHAGYAYSGPIAGTAYTCWKRLAPSIRRVLLIGPAHRAPLVGIAACHATAFATPLGSLPVDQTTLTRWTDEKRVIWHDEAHAEEHGLEVHCPFLQHLCPDIELVPLVVGQADPADVASLLADALKPSDTYAVISSDLSHYYDYATARRRDQATAEAITTGDITLLDGDCACGYVPIQGLLHWAQAHVAHCELLDLRSSGDTAGSRDRVVGYGAFACGPACAPLT